MRALPLELILLRDVLEAWVGPLLPESLSLYQKS